MRGVLHPAADAEYAEAVKYYSQMDPVLGVRFYREMERLILEVCDNPNRYWQFDPPARRHFSFEFPYAVIYFQKAEYVWIIAVMHMKRQPGYWRERLD